MKFTKMQGAGNDFVLVETSDTQRDWSRIALAICDRHFGIGADGLLLLMPSDRADCRMRILDCDGTEAEACGNGLRCLVRYFADGRAAGSLNGEISVETLPGIRKAVVYRTDGQVIRVKTGMGVPQFGAKDVPVALGQAKVVDIKSMLSSTITIDGRELELNFVSMGNPHAVYFCPEPVVDFPLLQIGPKVEHHEIFPRRVNFGIANVLNRRQLDARVWERGVGETLACGSGACAITVAARLHGFIDDKAEIKLPGGTLEVEWDGVGEVFLSGPAETVFSGEWPDGNY